MNNEDQAVHAAAVASHDGRQFQFSLLIGAAWQPGTFVTLTVPGGETQIGQVDEITVTTDGACQGAGRILGTVEAGQFDSRRSHPFTSAVIGDVDADTLATIQRSTGATLTVGSHLTAGDHPARLLPSRFNRHTFWCGQSGSGKTYALGVVLEQLLVQTALPIVIFDPNADFVRLREPAPHQENTEANRVIARRDIRILRPGGTGAEGLRVRFIDLPLTSKGAVLRLDPLVDRAEFNELLHLQETVGTLDPEQIVPNLLRKDTPAARALAARIENLRLTQWQVWAGENQTVTDIIEERPDATVLDLGGFAHSDESVVAAMAVLDDLWAKREQRRPVLLVIDEAHNFCSPENDSPLHRAVRERLIQIAAEGRKFGLWLLLSTQRPSRIHPSIISQCDNLALMKMTSPLDLAELATIFGFVPATMLTRSAGFRQGEALFAGGFAPAPTLVTMGRRLTREGGADVRVPIREDHNL